MEAVGNIEKPLRIDPALLNIFALKICDSIRHVMRCSCAYKPVSDFSKVFAERFGFPASIVDWSKTACFAGI
jgi:hypothetical protein